MKRLSVTRVVALMVLLLQGSAFGAVAVLDALIAARANGTVAHVEEKAGATCVAHDESTCQLCRAGTTSQCSAPQLLAMVPLVRAERPTGDAREHRTSIARTALHARAPPST